MLRKYLLFCIIFKKRQATMMNWIWLFFILSSVIISIFNGKIVDVSNAILSSAQSAVTICIGLVGIMALWLGLMRIAQQSGMIDCIAHFLSPLLKRLFPGVPKNDPVQADIALNISANALGLGNAATPFGIKAMEGLKRLNPNKPDTASDDMCTFLTINTAGVQLIPVSAIAILMAVGSENPGEILLPTLISTFSALCIGVIFVKCLIKLSPNPGKKK